MHELHENPHWRIGVWALRIGCVGLLIAIVGLALLSTPVVLAIGVLIWLASAIVMASEFLLARRDLKGHRPGFWPMRKSLIHDTFTAK